MKYKLHDVDKVILARPEIQEMLTSYTRARSSILACRS